MNIVINIPAWLPWAVGLPLGIALLVLAVVGGVAIAVYLSWHR